ncbi:MAG: amino acid adenylation domain-containing protein, partial [Candidatus Aminicenantes bacterium]
DFFELGGDSLKAMNVSNLIRKEMQIEIPVAEFFQRPTIEALAAYIMEKARQSEFYSIKPVEKKEYYPLSPAQKRLYFIHRMIQESTAYNMPHFITIQREMNRERLEFVCQQLIRRWESYRTSFEMINEGPVQRVHRHVEFKIEYYLDTGERRGHLLSRFFRPFDLSRAPLFRLGLIETGRDKYILMVDMHHIVSDGTSYLIWEKEMTALYTGEQLPELRLQYKDYSGWKNSEVRKAALKHQEKYWLKTFGGELPVVNLPADNPRPPLQQFEGANIDFLLNEKETRIIKAVMGESDVTLYMVLLSIYTILLSKLSGQEDIIIGTPIAGRSHADLQYIIGMFVNTLAMRNYPSGEKRFNEFLAEVKDNTLKAFENQEYQFEDLVDKLSVPRNISRNPVFDFMLNLLNQEEYRGPIPEINEQTGYGFAHREGTSKFDWNLTVIDLGERLFLNLEYSTRLFKAGTIERAVGYFRNIVSALSPDRTLKLADLDILTGEQKQEILHLARGVEETYDGDRHIHVTIQRLFEEQVERTPDNTAVVGPTRMKYRTLMAYISYRELNEKSNRLAWLLREKGIKPNTVVGLMAERSVEMIIAMLAIVKAGAAYLPIDDDYPAERKNYMLKDSGVRVLLTLTNQNRKTGRKPAYIPGNIEPIDLASENIFQADDSNPGRINRGADLLYVIYTSGSTGKPKGVMLEHRNLVNLVKYQFDYTNIDFSKVLQFTTISFDVSFQEIFSTLTAGGTLVLIDKETRNDIPLLFKTIEKNDIKTLFLPASYLKFVLSEEDYIDLMPEKVNHIVTAGEQAVITDELRRYLRLNRVYFHNHYGPTESHVVTTLTLGPDEEMPHLPSIGRPVSNTAIYIMNKGMHLVPTGVPGELVIGGMQVGRGYLNRPEITAEKFCLRRPGALFEKTAPGPRKNFLLEGTRGLAPLSLKAPGKNSMQPCNHASMPSPHLPISPIPQFPIYRTGDLARWLAEGNIEFLGRIDHQVKIRGFRVELGEIESRLLNHPDIKEAVVSARRDERENIYLCAYIVSDKELIVSDLREYLANGLPGYMIPQYFMQLERIPLNPNGKIDRKVLPEPVIKPGESYAAPQNEIEDKLAAIWQEVLGLDREIGIDDNFFELGGHSLKATILIAKILKILNIRVPLAEIFQTPDIRGIARYIMETGTTAAKPVRYHRLGPYEEKDYYPLSSAQKRLYVLDRLVLSNTVYNLPMVVVLEGKPDRQRVEEAFHKLIQRHESFRTSFVMANGEPYQKIRHEVEFEIEYHIAKRKAQSTERNEERHAPCAVRCASTIKNFIRPFDLSQAPLLRVGLVELQYTPTALRSHPRRGTYNSQEG